MYLPALVRRGGWLRVAGDAELNPFRTLTTGNLWFAMPRVSPPPGGVDRLAFLMMTHRGLIELTSGDAKPFLSGDVRVDGRSVLAGAASTSLGDWVPAYVSVSDGLEAKLTWLAPHEERGWVARLEVRNTGAATAYANLSFELNWGRTSISRYAEEPFDGRIALDPDGWGGGISLGWVTSKTEFAVGVGCTPGGCMSLAMVDSATDRTLWEDDPTVGAVRRFPVGARAVLRCTMPACVESGETVAFELFASAAMDMKAAGVDTRHLRERGFDTLLERTQTHLNELNGGLPEALEADEELTALARRNRLFCYYFSQGRTLDTEELCPVTSRSSDYYVSAAYWDRDSLLWSFPTILRMNPRAAADVLETAFGRQGRNIGIHSRFIDGSMYEPGFELDELCAPIVALKRYIRATDDWTILSRIDFDRCVERIERTLDQRRHPEIALFSTDYLPTDDLAELPYCIYDNVLVWATCGALSRITQHRKDASTARRWSALRDSVAEAVWTYGVTDSGGEKVFAWSTDLAGKFRLYDEPPGSLVLLAWYGFCAYDDPVFAATLRWIYSSRNAHFYPAANEIGCLHEQHPWMLAVANSLLLPQRRDAALAFLRRCGMDEGLACEAVDEHTGKVVSGRHFATCAGFLCNALVEAFETAPLGERLSVAR